MPRQKSGCYRATKSPCEQNAKCTWVKRKGCKTSPYRPRRSKSRQRRRASASRPPPCSRNRKAECDFPCKWHRGVGCRSMGDELVQGAARRLLELQQSEALALALGIRESMAVASPATPSAGTSSSASISLPATPTATSPQPLTLLQAIDALRQRLPTPRSPFTPSLPRTPLISPPGSSASLSLSPNTQLAQLMSNDYALTQSINEATRKGRVGQVVQLTAQQTQLRARISALQSLGAVPVASASPSASLSVSASSSSASIPSPPRLSVIDQLRREQTQQLKLKLVGIPVQRARLLQQLAKTTNVSAMMKVRLQLQQLDDAAAAIQAQIAALEGTS